MKLLIESIDKNFSIYKNKVDGVILALENFSVSSFSYYNISEIKDIVNTGDFSEYFVIINKNIYDKDISLLESLMIELDKIGVTGIFFYDQALIEIKKRLNLSVDLVWNQTHMVTNYKTCNYYFENGINYGVLSKEICLEDIVEIKNNTKMKLMCEVAGRFCIAFTRRSLVSNYSKDSGEVSDDLLELDEIVSKKKYICREEDLGNSFYTGEVINGLSAINELYSCNMDYIIIRGFGIDCFSELISDTFEYINSLCSDSNYLLKYDKLGSNSGFFYKKTIFKVKKNG